MTGSTAMIGERGLGGALLVPFFRMTRNRLLPDGRLSSRGVLVIGFGLGIAAALYLVSFKVVGYFHQQNELGIILSTKIFQMAWIVLFSMLVFSSMVSAVSNVFLSRDHEIIFSAPVLPRELFFMRYVTLTFYTSWMMFAFSIPSIKGILGP